jgi:hypothetical protein
MNPFCGLFSKAVGQAASRECGQWLAGKAARAYRGTRRRNSRQKGRRPRIENAFPREHVRVAARWARGSFIPAHARRTVLHGRFVTPPDPSWKIFYSPDGAEQSTDRTVHFGNWSPCRPISRAAHRISLTIESRHGACSARWDACRTSPMNSRNRFRSLPSGHRVCAPELQDIGRPTRANPHRVPMPTHRRLSGQEWERRGRLGHAPEALARSVSRDGQRSFTPRDGVAGILLDRRSWSVD